jgi:hypothetical protein
LILEKIDGGLLIAAPAGDEERRRQIQALSSLLDRMARACFCHLDLRSRNNLLVRADGEVVAVDLAASLWCSPGGAAARLLRPLLRWYYEGVVLKWRQLLIPDELTPQQRLKLRRHRRLRALWMFNRRGRRRDRSSRSAEPLNL